METPIDIINKEASGDKFNNVLNFSGGPPVVNDPLLDYFAAHALIGILSNDKVRTASMTGPKGPADELAETAWGMAKAMLRTKPK